MLYCYYESDLVKFYRFITKVTNIFFLKSSFLHLIVLPHILFYRSNFSKLSFIKGIFVIFSLINRHHIVIIEFKKEREMNDKKNYNGNVNK